MHMLSDMRVLTHAHTLYLPSLFDSVITRLQYLCMQQRSPVATNSKMLLLLHGKL